MHNPPVCHNARLVDTHVRDSRFAELDRLIRESRPCRAPRGSLRREILNERAAAMRAKYRKATA